MILIPYEVDVPSDRRPIMNWLIVAALVVVFILQNELVKQNQQDVRERVRAGEKIEQIERENPFESYVLYGWTVKGLLGHMWLHADWIHLVGNLIFLWLFGNAICVKVGNVLYLPVYLLLGLTAAAFHEMFSGSPAIGASGAINGIVGMYLVLFPENLVSCVFLFWCIRLYVRTFTISGIWLILLWFIYDIWGLMHGGGYVAYWAHVGGFVTGVGLALFLLLTKQISMEKYEKSLLQLVGLHKKRPIFDDEPGYRKDLAYWQRDFVDSQAARNETVLGQPISLAESDIESQAANEAGHKPQELSIKPENTIKVDELPAVPKTDETQIDEEFPGLLSGPAGRLEEELVLMTCSCGNIFSVPMLHCGKAVVCPRCNAHVKLPDENFVYTDCSCGESFKIPIFLAGRFGRCPRCKNRIKIPKIDSEVAFYEQQEAELKPLQPSETMSDEELEYIDKVLFREGSVPRKPEKPVKVSSTGKEQSKADTDQLFKRPENIYVCLTCSCSNKLMVPLTLSARPIICPRCKKVTEISEKNFIHMDCLCGESFKVPVLLAGRYGLCPRCKKRLKIPQT